MRRASWLHRSAEGTKAACAHAQVHMSTGTVHKPWATSCVPVLSPGLLGVVGIFGLAVL